MRAWRPRQCNPMQESDRRRTFHDRVSPSGGAAPGNNIVLLVIRWIMSNIPDVLLLFVILLTNSAPHVDFDVTSIPKADMSDANALVLHDMAMRSDALLSKTAKFFV